MRVIIAGGREFNNYQLVENECNRIFKELSDEGFVSSLINESQKEIEIVSGGARGADRLGEEFAKDYDLKIKRFPANWDLYGKRAGYMRNADMAIYAKQDEKIGVLIAFWDEKSKGTNHMIELGNKQGLRVFVVKYEDVI